LRRDQERAGKAYDVLRSVYSRFRESHGTVDLKSAKDLLGQPLRVRTLSASDHKHR
jgi:hypothetical protein